MKDFLRLARRFRGFFWLGAATSGVIYYFEDHIPRKPTGDALLFGVVAVVCLFAALFLTLWEDDPK
ncbi:hypothetical protein B5G43_16710 [Flavonifractor sp. An92]|uniref:hypothetical protein n=1 Tax=Flavonifractor sp. An92 TaxID=1965666 RepID=UPI000B3AAB01|nr:hypothetical protein [Flavonifractor sp. An92]OUN01976.1 hypothetical protein B5G43_16710 [Flavonifractor sp. An92]